MKPQRALSFLLVLFALGSTASAAPSAESLYTEGQAAYDRGDYATAIARWQASFDVSGATALLFNVAQAERLSGDCPRALATYRKFIAADPDPSSEQHKLAEDLERELAAKCVEPTPAPPPEPASGPGLDAAAHPTSTGDHEPEHPTSALRVAGIATGGAGIALLVTGLVVGTHANALGGEVTGACATSCDWSQLKSKDGTGRHEATVGYVLDGVGAAAIVGGVVMYYLGSRESSVSVAPASRAGGTVVSWSGSW